MEGPRLILLLLIVAVSSAYGQPISDCSNRTIYKGYISGDMDIWLKAMDEVKEEYNSTSDPCHLLTFVEARYGYIGYLFSMGKKSEAKLLVDIFEGDIEALSAFHQFDAETEAFRVALLGFRMELNPTKAVIIGPKAMKQLGKAMELGPSRPCVWIEKANSEAQMPVFAGGSKAKAVESFREALRLYEADPHLSPSNWKYLNTIVLLAQTLEKMEDYRGAAVEYRKALEREPSFMRVKDELLPAVEKRLE
jgi:tetratricopeptide (TPR) repeat protein